MRQAQNNIKDKKQQMRLKRDVVTKREKRKAMSLMKENNYLGER